MIQIKPQFLAQRALNAHHNAAARLAAARTARRTRRRGVAMAYAALGLASFLGVSALVVDLGYLYTRRAQAQRAADAAALAGARVLLDTQDESASVGEAAKFSRLNGYDAAAGAIVAGCPSNEDGACKAVVDSVAFTAKVSRREPLFFLPAFAALLGESQTSSVVGASAVAGITTDIAPYIGPPESYGQPDGPVNLSMFGPDGLYDNGDRYSVRTLSNGSPNPDYDGKGYDFLVNVPSSYTATEIEIFDPDTYNVGDDPNAFWENGKPVRIDEYRVPGGGIGDRGNTTTTRYQLFWDNGTPSDPTDDGAPIATVTYADDDTTDMKWVKAFNVDRAANPNWNFRLNATTIAGSSENGFTLRAGPPRGTTPGPNPGDPPTEDPFDKNNGTSVRAMDRVPINFNYDAETTVSLGEVPVAAAGRKLTITKFDTDVGSKSVRYTTSPNVGNFDGVLSDPGQYKSDVINLPSNYPGAIWTANYAAGPQDTSVWEMSYDGIGSSTGTVRLIR